MNKEMSELFAGDKQKKHGWGYTEDYRVGELTEVTFCVKT